MNFTNATMNMKNGMIMKYKDFIFRVKNNNFESKLIENDLNLKWVRHNINFEMVNSNKWKEHESIIPLNDKIEFAKFDITGKVISVNDVKKFINDIKACCINKSYYDGNSGSVVININDVTNIICKYAGRELIDDKPIDC